MRLFVIFNPHADRGRCLRLLRPLRDILDPASAEIALTEKAGDEIPLTRRAIASGFETIVAVGGDGTWNNVGGEIFKSGARVRLGLIPGGTGSDLARTMGLPFGDLAGCVRIIREGRPRAIDVGLADGRPFLNVAGFGLDTAVIEDVRRRRIGKGRLIYLLSALRRLYSYRGFDLELAVEGRDPQKHPALMLIVANARFFGGVFKIAPEADPADGQLDAVLFGNAPAGRRLPLMKHLVEGTHGKAPEVSIIRGRSFRLGFEAPPSLEVDGELYRAENKTVEITIVPGGLEIMGPLQNA